MRYRSISVFCLGGWSPASHGVSRVPRYSGAACPFSIFAYMAFTFFGIPSQEFRLMTRFVWQSSTRQSFLHRFGLRPVRSPLLGVSRLITLPRLLRCFSSPGSLPYSKIWVTGDKPCRIAPFGDLRVNGHLHLSAAFRSLSRPSSADIAKASTVCSYYLSLCKIHTLTFLAFKISLDLLSFLRYVGKFMLMKFSFVSFLLYSFQRAGISY